MKKVLYYLSFAVALFSSSTSEASQTYYGAQASQLIQGASQITTSDYSAIPDLIIFEESKQPAHGNPELWLRLTFAMGSEYGLKVLSVDADQIGYTHYRYQQTVNGYPIDGTMWLVHVKNNKVVSMNGLLFNTFKQKNQSALSESDALAKALVYVNASSYKWQNAEEEAALKQVMNDAAATYFPKGELMYARDSRNLKFDYRLTYRFDIYAHEPMSRQYIFVDANTGTITDVQNRIWEANRTGTAVTAYAGTQTIITDSTSNSYRLREAGRGAGLGMETYNLAKGTTYTNTDFTDADNYWNNVNANKDQYATDCHLASEKTYDYYYNNFGRNSINNAGLKLLAYVHYSTNYVNAFWDGSRMTYGDGNTTYSPLTSLDIGGHEITHGLTQYTANLTYSYESGALNESFSDCFGTAIEWYADPVHGDWLIGEDIGAPFRSHSNPNAYGDPDTYLGTNWYTGTADNGGVHTNSGVQNYWFYLLANGGSGTNDIGNAFNVTGITLAKASAIAFRSLTVYLTSSSNYANARTYSIQAATDLYGACSPEVIATTNAWYAVGVGSQSSGGASTVTASGQTTICNGSSVTLNASAVAGSTYQWNKNGAAIAGATSTTYNASQAGTYTVTTTGCGASSYTSNSLIVTIIAVTSTISPSGTASGCTSVLLTAGGTAGYGYQWKNNGNAISGATNSTYTATASGNYTLTLQATSYPNQNFSSSGATSIPDNTCTNPAINTINVSGYNGVVNSSGITCTVNITHTYDGDINFMLEAPNGDVIGLSDFAGGAGDNFTNTIFSDAGATSVGNGTAPFTGTYKPWQALITSCTNSNKIGFGAIGGGTINPNGAWKLRVYDRYAQDLGTINSWSLSIPSYTVPNPNCGPVTSPSTAVTIGGGLTVSAGTYSPVCANSSPVTLTGSPAGGIFSGTGVTGNSFNPNVGAGTYPVTYSYTDALGCSGQNTTNIVVNALPTVTATNVSGCAGSSIALAGSPAGGTWSVANPYSGSSTTYTHTYTDANGCTNTSAAANITVNPLPTVSAGSYPPVCDKSVNVPLNGSPAGGTWSGTGVSGSEFSPATVNPGTYPVTYTYTDANGCTNSSTTNIVVNALPNVSTGTYPATCDTVTTPVALNGGSPVGGTWTGAGVSGNNFYPNVAGVGNWAMIYTYTDPNGCTSNAFTPILVNSCGCVAPGQPGTSAGNTYVCKSSTGNVFSVSSVSGATAYNWTVPTGATITAGQGTTSITVTFSSTQASGNLCVNASNACGTSSSSCRALTVVTAKPGVPVSISGPLTPCANTTGIVYSCPPVANTQSYAWVVPTGATITAGQGTNSITVDFGAAFTSGYVRVSASNCIGTSSQRSITVYGKPTTPGTIVGSINGVCAGSTNVPYSIPAIASASTYTWIAPANATIAGGQGTNSVLVNFGASFTSGTLSVTADNNCGSSTARTATIRSTPLTPGTITGATTAVCAGSANVPYSVTAVTGATTYTWTTPANVSIASGQGTNSVLVNFGAAFTSGTLSVTAGNACGNSTARTAAIGSVPATPGTITGAASVCANQTGISYSVALVASATSYLWTVPATCTITAGQGTNAITVNWGTATGSISVKAQNACGFSALRSKSVSVTCRNAALGVEEQFNIYPNPATDNTTFSFISLAANRIQISVVDMVGRIVSEMNSVVVEGENKIEFNTSEFAKGVYLVNVKSEDGFAAVKRLVVE